MVLKKLKNRLKTNREGPNQVFCSENMPREISGGAFLAGVSILVFS